MRVAAQNPIPVPEIGSIQVWHREKCLRSIERPQGQIRVLFDGGAFEVVSIEIQPRSALEEPYLWGETAILVLSEGELLMEEGGDSYEVLHGDSIRLGKQFHFRLVNRQPHRALLYGIITKEEGQNPPPREGGQQ
ncbi:MAG: hypothetical protein HYY65_03470 [Candidatus Tectomicrobia bacterium]|uniref:Cupin domain-containing protein n=1 Tax=Tectimicrobiota bacterium TaxID=2528274 RepID=A0A932GNA7_UNCTE|nr:hypothetical protein [Candidatus Tectomicrobia bacterium]